ncbi:chemotaxis protein CheB [Shumkonia mesophila]|uniref:chemotaxis protein CheB n=1 Tax=Shumkonia mesophila TaxID=2838854 RepID=UPI0029345472|nr:chemotaxis protein CheB [Shumkonia mesophila]
MAKVDEQEQARDEQLTPVCAIGASAGGVAALQEFFSRIPDDLGLAYVVIIHLAPDHPSHMSEILTGRTAMPVHQVTDSLQLRPNCVYVIPPDRELVIEGNNVQSREFSQPRGRRAPIDVFFRSVAAGRGDGLAVVMTGAGSDGALGVKAVKEQGGVVFVQDPAEAEYPMMPRNAIATGVADFIGPVHHLVEWITEVVRSKNALSDLREEEADEALRNVLGFLQTRTGHDFSGYKRATVLRRVARRVQVARSPSLSDYARYLRENAEEAQQLFEDMLISVTSFFRDHDAFATLAEKAVKAVCEKTEGSDGIRAWVVGCATGEEAYSLAILLLEEADRRKVFLPIQVFATDLDEGALATAREGRYPRAIEADVSEERLQRYFSREGEHYRIRQEVRDVVLFASHSALKDPPFIRVDLITCRNLLIYLERELQTQVCGVFHYALNPHGFLFLGSAETADAAPELFKPVDRAARLYQAKSQAVPHVPLLPGAAAGRRRSAAGTATSPRVERFATLKDLHAASLELAAPPSALVDDSLRVLHLSPNAGNFIRPSEGAYTAELPALVRSELRLELRGALQRAFETGEPILTLPVPVAFNGSRRRVLMKVAPMAADGEAPAQALVFFIDGGLIEPSDDAHEAGKDGQSAQVRRLMDELQAAEERLRQSRLEHEQATQELRATNEELQSINEEYRSTSEELETSKEELQSINEELQTVNAELKSKLETISSAHSDLQNLIAATDIGTLFLDSELRIRMFTPAVAGLFSINENDVGRPIIDFKHNLDHAGIEADARGVLRTLVPVEREVGYSGGRSLMMRIRPYRSVDNRIEGLVATFIDVTELRKATAQLRESERLRRMIETEAVGIIFLDEGGRLIDSNNAFLRMTGFAREAVSDGRLNWRTLTPPDWMDLTEREMAKLAETGRIGPYEKEYFREDGSRMWILFAGQGLGDGTTVEFCLDISERKAAEDQRALLLRELSHRVKNTLAVVQSIAHQTLRTSDSVEAFAEAFERRLQALAHAHALLTPQNWTGALLGDLVAATMESFLPDGDARVKIDGPPISLSANATVSFTMALHEMGTNAVKHGALSTQKGVVEIGWRVAEPQPGKNGRLIFTWTEHGGPKVAQPKRKGFGSKMIEKGVAHALGAQVAIDYREAGVICTMELPLGDKIRIA